MEQILIFKTSILYLIKSDGLTALWVAVQNGNIDFVQELVVNGGNIDAQNK